MGRGQRAREDEIIYLPCDLPGQSFDFIPELTSNLEPSFHARTAKVDSPRHLGSPRGIPFPPRRKSRRQRAMMAEGHLLLVLHAPPKNDEPDRKGRLFWRKPDGTWQSNELGAAGGAAKHLSEYSEIIDKMDRQEDVAWSVDEYYTILDAMGPIQRTARNLHATLQEARKLSPPTGT